MKVILMFSYIEPVRISLAEIISGISHHEAIDFKALLLCFILGRNDSAQLINIAPSNNLSFIVSMFSYSLNLIVFINIIVIRLILN